MLIIKDWAIIYHLFIYLHEAFITLYVLFCEANDHWPMQKYPLLILIFKVNSQAGNFPETVLHAFNFWLLSVTIFFVMSCPDMHILY